MPSAGKRTLGVKEHLDTVKPIPMEGGSAQNFELQLRMIIMMNGSPMLLPVGPSILEEDANMEGKNSVRGQG